MTPEPSDWAMRLLCGTSGSPKKWRKKGSSNNGLRGIVSTREA